MTRKTTDYMNITIALIVAIPIKTIIHLFKGIVCFFNEQKNFYKEIKREYKEV